MLWGALIGVVVSVAIEVVAARMRGEPISLATVGRAALVGAVTGAVGGAIAGRILQGAVTSTPAPLTAARAASVRANAYTAGGAGGDAAGGMVENAVDGRALQDDLASRAVRGALLGRGGAAVENGVRRGVAAVANRAKAKAKVEQRSNDFGLRPGHVESIDPALLRYSATPTARGTPADYREAEFVRGVLKAGGWQGEPADVVLTAEGPVTLNNVAVAVARELGLKRIPIRVHAPDEPMRGHGTWGRALERKMEMEYGAEGFVRSYGTEVPPPIRPVQPRTEGLIDRLGGG